MHARVVLGAGEGVLIKEVSSVQRCPYREVPLYNLSHSSLSPTPTLSLLTLSHSHSLTPHSLPLSHPPTLPPSPQVGGHSSFSYPTSSHPTPSPDSQLLDRTSDSVASSGTSRAARDRGRETRHNDTGMYIYVYTVRVQGQCIANKAAPTRTTPFSMKSCPEWDSNPRDSAY